MMYSQDRKKLILLGVALMVFIAIWIIISVGRSGWISLSAPKDTPKDARVTVELKSETFPSKSIELVAGESKRVRVRTGTWQVFGKTGDIQSIDVVRVKGFSTTRLETPLGQSHQIQQLGSAVYPCIVAPSTGTLFSYSCGSGSNIIKHTLSPALLSVNTPLFEQKTFGHLEPLKNGVIGFSTDYSKLEYIDLISETRKTIELPAAVKSATNATYSPEVITANQPGKSAFVVVSPGNNRLYVYTDIEDTNPVEIRPVRGVNIGGGGRAIYTSVTDDRIVLYAGVAREDEHSDLDQEIATEKSVEQADSKTKKSDLTPCLLEYSLDGKLTKEIKLPNDFDATSLKKLGHDFYISEDESQTNFYRLDGENLQYVYGLSQAGTWVTIKDNSYLQADRSLYKFTPRDDGTFTLRSVYSSEDIFVSSLFAGTQGVVFTGYSGSGDDQQLNAYQLLDALQAPGQVQNVEPEYNYLFLLTNKGITNDQVGNFKYALGLYASSAGIKMASVTISDVNLSPWGRYSNNDSGFRTATFVVTLNNKTKLKASLDYEGFTRIKLRLSDESGKQLYDSGEINQQSTSL